MDTAFIAASITAFIFVVTAVGGVVTYLLRQRGTTGTTRTSDAAVLWEQAQVMRAELTEALEKMTAQRDKIMQAQESQVLPVLSAIGESLKQITASLARLERKGQ
jgi:biopolymer transport protein ExbB/TolQ